MNRILMLAVAVAAAATASCGQETPPSPSTPTPSDGPPAGSEITPAVSGRASSNNFEVRFRVSALSSAKASESTNYRVRMGTRAQGGEPQ